MCWWRWYGSSLSVWSYHKSYKIYKSDPSNFLSLIIITMKIKNFYHLNQFVLEDSENNQDYFQSYQSMICKVDRKEKTITFGSDWDYSITTLKHLYKFLDEYTCLSDMNKKKINDLIKIWIYHSIYSDWKIVYNEDL